MRWLVVLLGLVLGMPAQATILFASGEDSGFTAIGANVAGSSASLSSRTGFARTATTTITTFPGGTAADPVPSRFQTPAFAATSTLWVHGWFYTTFGGVPTANQQALIIRSPDGVSRIVVRLTGTTGQLKVSTRNAAGTIVDLATASSNFSLSTLTQFDLFVNYQSSGGVQLYLNSVPVINYSGNPLTDSATQLNQVELSGVGSGSSATNGTGWSEVIIADQDTRGMALFTMPPQASGNTQSWTPNTLANINKAVINDGTSISTATNNALSEWTLPTAAPSGSWSVLAVTQDARVNVGASGPQHFDWLTRVGVTDYLAGAPAAPTTSFANYNHIWPTNPGTGSAWTISDITAVGFNLGIESQP